MSIDYYIEKYGKIEELDDDDEEVSEWIERYWD